MKIYVYLDGHTTYETDVVEKAEKIMRDLQAKYKGSQFLDNDGCDVVIGSPPYPEEINHLFPMAGGTQ